MSDISRFVSKNKKLYRKLAEEVKNIGSLYKELHDAGFDKEVLNNVLTAQVELTDAMVKSYKKTLEESKRANNPDMVNFLNPNKRRPVNKMKLVK